MDVVSQALLLSWKECSTSHLAHSLSAFHPPHPTASHTLPLTAHLHLLVLWPAVGLLLLLP